jgi:hypothetical protein
MVAPDTRTQVCISCLLRSALKDQKHLRINPPLNLKIHSDHPASMERPPWQPTSTRELSKFDAANDEKNGLFPRLSCGLLKKARASLLCSTAILSLVTWHPFQIVQNNAGLRCNRSCPTGMLPRIPEHMIYATQEAWLPFSRARSAVKRIFTCGNLQWWS